MSLVSRPDIDAKQVVFSGILRVEQSFSYSLHPQGAHQLIENSLHHSVVEAKVIFPQYGLLDQPNSHLILLALNFCLQDELFETTRDSISWRVDIMAKSDVPG